MSDNLDDTMLLSECINDITQSAINTQIKLVDKYLDNFLEDFELIKDGDNEYYKPKKIIIQDEKSNKFEISNTTLKNNNQLSLKDFNVNGTFRVVSKKNKFWIDFNNNKGIDLNISINLGKINLEDDIDEINNVINKLSDGKKF